MENNSNLQEPLIFNKYLVSLTKIIAFYSIFFVLIKSIAIVRGAWLMPNILVSIPIIAVGIWCAFTSYTQKYNWFAAGFGTAVVIIMRYFEEAIVFYLNANL